MRRSALAVILALTPWSHALGLGAHGAGARAKGPARVTAAYAAALRAAGGAPGFAQALRAELRLRLPLFVEDPARATRDGLAAARRLGSGPLTAREAADIAGLMLVVEPSALREALPEVARLDPGALGEIAAFDAASREDGGRRLPRVDGDLRALFDGVPDGGLGWAGRTLVADLGDGSAVAVKLRKGSELPGDLEEEARLTREVGYLPGEISKPIPGRDGRYETEFHTGGSGIVYTAPLGFFKYLNDPGTTLADLRRGLRNAVAQMAALAERGRYHESLAAVSHSEARWRWNYFRWTNMSFGPTALHDWREGLLYPNLRRGERTGLADFAHVVSLENAEADLARSMRGDGHVESKAIDTIGGFDVEHTLVGQNLTELALVALHSAVVNGIPLADAAREVVDALGAYVTERAGAAAWAAFSRDRLEKAVLATGRGLKFDGSLLGGLWNGAAAVWEGRMPGGLPAEALRPLISEAVWPLAEAVAGRRVEPKDASADPAPMIWLVLGVRNLFMSFLAGVLAAVVVGIGWVVVIPPAVYIFDLVRGLLKASAVLDGLGGAVAHAPPEALPRRAP